MKHIIVFIVALIATPTIAQPSQRVSRTAVLDNITVTPDNGGINPAFSASTISARVMLGANACAAQGLTGRLQMSHGFDGKIYVYGLVSGYQRQGLACPYNFDPVYAEVSTTLRDRIGFENKTYLLHAFERGLTVSLTRLIQCDQPKMCSREYDPQVCDYQGIRFEDQNLCMTAAKAEMFACVKGLVFHANDMACSSLGAEAPIQ